MEQKIERYTEQDRHPKSTTSMFRQRRRGSPLRTIQLYCLRPGSQDRMHLWLIAGMLQGTLLLVNAWIQHARANERGTQATYSLFLASLAGQGYLSGLLHLSPMGSPAHPRHRGRDMLGHR